jgi:hypothetical protein
VPTHANIGNQQYNCHVRQKYSWRHIKFDTDKDKDTGKDTNKDKGTDTDTDKDMDKDTDLEYFCKTYIRCYSPSSAIWIN